jgi:hypothetical protein
MEKNMKTATLVGTALTVISLTTLPALAAPKSQYQVKGQNAYASFYQYEDCSYTYVDVYAFDNLEKSALGAPTSQTGAWLYYSTYNYCDGIYSFGSASSDTATVTINNSAQSASLTGTFTLYDYYSNTSKTANVNLTWTATGTTYRSNSHSNYQGPGYFSTYRSKGTTRDASITGSININGSNLIAGLSSYASITSSNNGSLTIYKRN